MGGSKRALLSTVAVFTFVALWHDLSLTLLTWGWLVSFVVIPEVLAGRILPSSKFGDEWWYRHVCCVGGVVNVLTMTSANLIGFVIGIQGMKEMIEGIWGSWRGERYLVLFFDSLGMLQWLTSAGFSLVLRQGSCLRSFRAGVCLPPFS